jgi:hypothetical protein
MMTLNLARTISSFMVSYNQYEILQRDTEKTDDVLLAID